MDAKNPANEVDFPFTRSYNILGIDVSMIKYLKYIPPERFPRIRAKVG